MSDELGDDTWIESAKRATVIVGTALVVGYSFNWLIEVAAGVF